MGSQIRAIMLIILAGIGLPTVLIFLWGYSVLPYEIVIGITTFGMLGLIVYVVKYLTPIGQDSNYLYKQIAIRSEYGEHDKAIKFFSQILEKNKKDKAALQNLSAAYLFKGDYDKTIEICNRLLELKPNKSGALHNLAIAYSFKGRHDEAIDLFESIVQEEPRNYYLWYEFAKIYIRKGYFNKAFECIDKALELKFNFREALILREEIQSKVDKESKKF